ncbi:MAG: maleylpyruvate isomerase family mycothiol-dependent enzyme [Ornithinimicrobium sp.]|uniref:maleylpyruvate isomerase family mycothiol-dependent enzyme n=1 Tax=Ornithinimicrobium sp. TaxID=1977084 RepID=UPI0026DF71A7|nr:maleylpyruvate isomerase family mycothiol-dependent enzyme [Ornithinimicrobium sp.]MDO5739396.1 maleylpyruvate isomerase family mycothiol-dependent enzyme [Ornithinimicrobium sp.]
MTTRELLWSQVHAERAALVHELAELTDEQWASPSLCGDWSVHDVVAHLTAAASVGRLRWIASVLGARLDFDLHNQRRLAEQRGTTTAQTLERFRTVVTSTTAASGHTAAWLGEVVVHSHDIRWPLGLPSTSAPDVVAQVATFYAQRDFTVPSKTAINGLRLEATDSDFHAGAGELVRGTTLALTMAMAGRSVYCVELSGPGTAALRAYKRPSGHGDSS